MLIEAPKPHWCDKPKVRTWKTVETGRTMDGEVIGQRRLYHVIPQRSLFRCEECGKRWILMPSTTGGGVWRTLRWYHQTTVGVGATALEQRRARERRRQVAWFILAFVWTFVMVSVLVGWLT